jgi:hypothetical protein
MFAFARPPAGGGTTAPAPDIPTKATEALSLIVGTTIENINQSRTKKGETPILPRQIFEALNAQSQGKNTLYLAERLVEKVGKYKTYKDKYSNDPNFRSTVAAAAKFIEDWKSDSCYICGLPITKDTDEELEHICPLVQGAGVLDIMKYTKKYIDRNLDDILLNSPNLILFFYEYARSHRCCNQAKGNLSFIETNEATVPYVSSNDANIRSVLGKIHDSITGIQPFHADKGGCREKVLKDGIGIGPGQKKKEKEDFVSERLASIKDNFVDRIVVYSNHFISSPTGGGGGSLEFAKMIQIAKQAMGANETIFQSLGLRFTGDPIGNDEFFTRCETMLKKNIVTGSKQFYQVKMPKFLENLQSLPGVAKQIKLVYDNETAQSPRGPSRKIDSTKLVGLLSKKLTEFKLKQSITSLKRYYSFIDYMQSIYFFGIVYAKLIIKKQAERTFRSDMVELFVNLIKNINERLTYMAIVIIIFGGLPSLTPEKIDQIRSIMESITPVYGFDDIHRAICDRLSPPIDFNIQFRDSGPFVRTDSLETYENLFMFQLNEDFRNSLLLGEFKISSQESADRELAEELLKLVNDYQFLEHDAMVLKSLSTEAAKAEYLANNVKMRRQKWERDKNWQKRNDSRRVADLLSYKQRDDRDRDRDDRELPFGGRTKKSKKSKSKSKSKTNKTRKYRKKRLSRKYIKNTKNVHKKSRNTNRPKSSTV